MSKGRYVEYVFNNDGADRYIVVFSMTWEVIEVEQSAKGNDHRAAFQATLARVRREGWTVESEPKFGSCFINKDGVRRLVSLSPKNPHEPMGAFSPHT